MKPATVVSWVRSHWLVSALAGAVLLVLAIYAVVTISDWSAVQSVEKKDQQLQQNINANEKAAAAAETNANTHRDDAQAAEGRHQRSLEQWQAAGENSNRSAEQVRKAHQREEQNRGRTVTGPAFTDAELCAELAKRGIPCR